MSPLKFFRKYQKGLLGVACAFLMVVFLLPSAGLGTTDHSSDPIGTLDGKKITGRDRRQAKAEADIMARLLPQEPLPTDGLEWLLLVEDARRNGIYSSRVEATPTLAQIKLSPGYAQFIRDTEASDGLIVSAIQHARMILQLKSLIMTAARVSEPRLRHAARDLASSATVDVVAVDSSSLFDKVTAPTDAEIAAQFEKYKDVAAGTPPLGFGYRLPNRVKLEWLTVPLDRVAATVKIDEVATYRYYTENQDKYLPTPSSALPPSLFPTPTPAPTPTPTPTEPKDKAPAPSEEKPVDPATKGAKLDNAPKEPAPTEPKKSSQAPSSTDSTRATETQPDAKPADAKPADVKTADVKGADPKPADAPPAGVKPADVKAVDVPAVAPTPAPAAPLKPLPYKEVRERIIKELTDREARAVQDRIIKNIQAQLTQKLRSLPVDNLGYRVLPADYKAPDLDEAAKSVQKEFGVLPDYHRVDDHWVNLDKLNDVPGLAKTSVEISTQGAPLAYYMNSAKEFPGQNDVLRSLRLQVNVPSKPITNDVGDRSIFRLLAADPQHVAKSLDEVKEQVATDLKRVAAFKLLQLDADKLIAEAQTEGLAKLAETYKTTVEKIGPFSGASTLRQSLPVVGRSRAFTDAVFALAQKVQQGGGLGVVDAKQTFAAIPVDTAQKLAIVKLTEYQPLDSDSFNMFKPELPRTMEQMQQFERMRAASGPVADPFSLKALEARLKFKSKDSRPSSPGDEEEAPDAHSGL
jgi:hypothetical protein